MTERLHFHFSLSFIGEGNGNPLQYSCLENLRDRGAWWAAVYGVAQSRTRLKRLSSSKQQQQRHFCFTEKNLKCNDGEGLKRAARRKPGRVSVRRRGIAAAKSLQSCPTLCDPRDGSPPGSPVPEILQARTLEWVAISFSNA